MQKLANIGFFESLSNNAFGAMSDLSVFNKRMPVVNGCCKKSKNGLFDVLFNEWATYYPSDEYDDDEYDDDEYDDDEYDDDEYNDDPADPVGGDYVYDDDEDDDDEETMTPSELYYYQHGKRSNFDECWDDRRLYDDDWDDDDYEHRRRGGYGRVIETPGYTEIAQKSWPYYKELNKESFKGVRLPRSEASWKKYWDNLRQEALNAENRRNPASKGWSENQKSRWLTSKEGQDEMNRIKYRRLQKYKQKNKKNDTDK